ncbi:MAG: hypothetical protein AAGA60_24325 [Cyanobacteria bacterium P01_E01_bin.42]
MNIPKHLWRYPTGEAIDSLAIRFNLRNTGHMQDWEYEVADAKRIDEFVAAYENEPLSEDEKFTLMEIIIQSFEDLSAFEKLDNNPLWMKILQAVECNINLHIHTVWYWADPENESDENDLWVVTPFFRKILAKYREHFETV